MQVSQEMISELSKLLEDLKKKVYHKVMPLSITAWTSKEPISYNNRMTGEPKAFQIGDKWGDLWDCGWFHFEGYVPIECKGKSVVLTIDLSGEGCVFDHQGCPVIGLTTSSSIFDGTLGIPDKKIVPITPCARGKEPIDIWVEAGCNDLFGNYRTFSNSGIIESAHITVCDEALKSLMYDVEVLFDLMQSLPTDGLRFHNIYQALLKVYRMMHAFSQEEIETAKQILKEELDKKNGDTCIEVTAIGHSHIDLAWFWPIRETIRKGSRTFATVLHLMDRYGDFIFGASQPQLYVWMRDHYPQLYMKIKEKVKAGRWECQGAFWVEPDTNIPSGESLVRQILQGKAFFKDEFQKDINIAWLPDVFGFSGALPQILNKSGISYFMTTKLGWNRYNPFPHSTFIWQGIDGSGVLSHMPPEGGVYNSPATPKSLGKIEKNFIEKGISNQCMLLYGIGDGGGGPGEEHIERLMREKNLEGLPKIVHKSGEDFFRRIEENKEQYPKYCGELYFERTQGCYSSVAQIKKLNRKVEIALYQAEFLSVLAYILCKKVYPKAQLKEFWREVLLYQFHDILPGTSIQRVYDECFPRYEYILDELAKISRQAVGQLAGKSEKGQLAAFNLLGTPQFHQGHFIPSFGMKNMLHQDTFSRTVAITNVLENQYVRIDFHENGSISSIWDKLRERVAVSCGGNELRIFKDDGDAWDFSIDLLNTDYSLFKLEHKEVVHCDDQDYIKFHYRHSSSVLVQKVILYHHSARIDFETNVDWQEEKKLLKAVFPIEVVTDFVECDIQYGTIKRPMHTNHATDMAKYEICAHQWVDVSDGDYGVAILNDCKYGHSARGNLVTLTLLRATQYPGTHVDRGFHTFTYSIFPHSGDYRSGCVDEEAQKLNHPVLCIENVKCGSFEEQISWIDIENPAIIVDAFKMAENSNHIILRCHENHHAKQSTHIHFGFHIQKAYLCDMMENIIEELPVINDTIQVAFGPFEIHTFLLKQEED